MQRFATVKKQRYPLDTPSVIKNKYITWGESNTLHTQAHTDAAVRYTLINYGRQ